MLQVRVAGVALDASGQHVLLLKPIDELPGSGRILPIWIGQMEATSILVAVEGAEVPRPLAHDLMLRLLDTAGAELVQVGIARIDDGTFYAEATVSTSGGAQVVDARPSDAIALASRAAVPILVADEVMMDAGVPDFLPEEDVSERLDEFKRFLDDIEPEDFAGPDD